MRHRAATAALAAYAAIGLLLFARILRVPFLSDDWEFLVIVERAQSVLVIFEPLVGRFIRPFVVLLYYANFKAFGLNPLPYHLALVLVHILNAWLVYLLALRLDGERRRQAVAFFAGLLFLVFSAHSEAVSWVAGAADPLVVPFLLGSLLCFARGLDPRSPIPASPWRWFAGGWGLFVLGMLAKEVGALLPGLAICYGCLHASRGGDWRKALTRTAQFAAVPLVLVATYLLMRAAIFGNPFSAYAELGPKGGVDGSMVRAFVLRSIFPPDRWLETWWLDHRDMVLLAACAAAVAGAALLERMSNWRGILFALAGVVIGLVPVVRLSIAIGSTESERYVYVASVFSCILIVQVIAALLRPRLLAITAMSAVVALHATALDRSNRTWRDAGAISASMLSSFVDTVRGAPASGQVYVMSVPDSVRGAYVFRRGFATAVHLAAPDLDGRPIQILATQSLDRARDRHVARQTSPRTFTLDIFNNLFVQPAAPATPWYAFPEWGPRAYTVTFADTAPPGPVIAFDQARARAAGAVVSSTR